MAEKEKTGCFHTSSFFLYFITSGSGKKLIQSNCLKNCAENQTGCLKKEKLVMSNINNTKEQYELNRELAQMLKGGVIMDVTNAEQAKTASESGDGVTVDT